MRHLAVCTKKHFVFFFFNLFFYYYYSWKSKPGISIPDLYFYDVKILPDINPNDIKNTRKNYKMLKQIRWTVTCEQYHRRKRGILIPNLYFYDVKFRSILSKIVIKKDKYILKKNIYITIITTKIKNNNKKSKNNN